MLNRLPATRKLSAFRVASKDALRYVLVGTKRRVLRDAKFMLQSTFSSVETRRSWVVAAAALLIMGVAFGAPWITLVALKDIAAEVRGERSIPAFASALMWMGSGVGGILMGQSPNASAYASP